MVMSAVRLISFLLVCLVIVNEAQYNVTELDEQSIKWIKEHHPMELLPISEQLAINGENYANFRKGLEGVIFSGVFTDYGVLQRGPQLSSIYGAADTPNAQILLTMIDEINHETTSYKTNSMDNGDWKITLSKPYPNGGNYTFTVQCQGCKTTQSDSIRNMVFGDVFFCSGQSNMQVPLQYTFSKNYTFDNITKLSKYSNIHFYTAKNNQQPNATYVIARDYQKYPEYVWNIANKTSIPTLDQFSATCWYTAQMLSDNHGMSDIHLGMIDVAVGGTQIESWTKNHTIENYCNNTQCPGALCGGLYNGNVMPWINMTIKANLWWQGENNIHEGYGGSWLNKTGYSCMEKLMIEQWRSNFSVEPQTTSSSFPFGIVQLASGTSEGNQRQMPYFRWAQSLNFDILPPIESNAPDFVENLFLIQAHDIGDPWYSGCGGNCQDPAAPYSANETDGNGTNWFMGPIHPRPKIFAGERLARVVAKFVYGVDQIYSGPVITGCTLDDNSNKMNIFFNKTLMYDEELFYQKFEAWYNKTLTNNYQNAIELNYNDKWIFVNDSDVSVDNANGPSVILDMSAFDSSNITEIRYAWSDYPCCGDINKKQHPCPMNMCPFQTSKTRLPAVPFYAQIVDGKCKCFAPQTC